MSLKTLFVNLSVLLIDECHTHVCLCLPDVPAVVYSRHPEAASGSRSPLPAARHGGRVRHT